MRTLNRSDLHDEHILSGSGKDIPIFNFSETLLPKTIGSWRDRSKSMRGAALLAPQSA